LTLLDRLERSIESLVAGNILTPTDGDELKVALRADRVDFKVPKRVSARFRGREYGLDDFWCTRCGMLWSAAEIRDLRCRNCGASLIQAYVFVSYFRHKPPRPPSLSDIVRLAREDPNAACPIAKNQEKLKRLSRESVDRPVESLSWKCFDPKANKSCAHLKGEWCTHDTYSSKKHGGAWPVRLRFFQRRALLGVGLDRTYTPTTPTEAITKPITISIHHYDPTNAQELKIVPGVLPDCVEGVYYLRKFEAFQFTLGLAMGFPSAPLRFRATILAKDKEITGRERTVILSRRLESSGLLVKVRKSGLEFPEQVVLHHTVSHAFLRPLPLTVGLDPTEFFESIDVDSNEVVLYDNSPGGIGGVAGVVEDGELRVEYQERIIPMVRDCALECRSACKACLFIENCGRLNRQLNRRYLCFAEAT